MAHFALVSSTDLSQNTFAWTMLLKLTHTIGSSSIIQSLFEFPELPSRWWWWWWTLHYFLLANRFYRAIQSWFLWIDFLSVRADDWQAEFPINSSNALWKERFISNTNTHICCHYITGPVAMVTHVFILDRLIPQDSARLPTNLKEIWNIMSAWSTLLSDSTICWPRLHFYLTDENHLRIIWVIFVCLCYLQQIRSFQFSLIAIICSYLGHLIYLFNFSYMFIFNASVHV